MVTETSLFPDMSGDSRGNFFWKNTNPNRKEPQRDMPNQMTSLAFHLGHPQPNAANAQQYVDKVNYRTPHIKTIDLKIKQDGSMEKLDKIIDQYTDLYQKEKVHQKDIETNAQFSHQDYLNGKLKKKKADHKKMKDYLVIQV